jgi:hypothetical protein
MKCFQLLYINIQGLLDVHILDSKMPNLLGVNVTAAEGPNVLHQMRHSQTERRSLTVSDHVKPLFCNIPVSNHRCHVAL